MKIFTSENDIKAIYTGPIYQISIAKFLTHKNVIENGCTLRENLFTLICEDCSSRFSNEIDISSPPTRYSSYNDLSCDEAMIKNIIE